MLTWSESLGKPECPYLRRWAINLGPFGSIRLHHWINSDDKRYKHDHPSDFITLVLKGYYHDVGMPDPDRPDSIQTEKMCTGAFVRRKAEHIHYVDVPDSGCWTLLYFFPNRRKWGFWVPRKDTGKYRFRKSNKYFIEHGHHPCD